MFRALIRTNSIISSTRRYMSNNVKKMSNPSVYASYANNFGLKKVADIIEEFHDDFRNVRGKCMDIGCGPGNVTYSILSILDKNAKMIGTDISQDMIEYAKEHYGIDGRLEFEILDIQTKEFPKKYVSEFDHIFSFYTFHWCNDIRTGYCPLFGSSMTQTEFLQELANECRYDKMVPPPGVINEMDSIRIYIRAFIYTIKFNMAKTLDHVRNEVSAVIQANGGKLTMSALNNMPYLERCLKESLRLYPSVPFISRVTSQDVKMQSYLVPTGAVLHINIYDIHRDPNFWPNPEVFDPDRFLPERIQNRHPYSYLPFSAGPRNCIGQRFAMLELKAIISSLVYNFYLEPVDYLKDLRFMTDIVNRVTHPIRTRFVPIDRMPSDSSKVI